MCRFRAKTRVSVWLRSVLTEKFIFKRFSHNVEIDIYVRVCSICRFLLETRVLVCLRSVLTENVILTRFRVIRSRSTFNVRYCSMFRFRSQNARISLGTICSFRKRYFEAIRSHKVVIEISYEIFLNLSLSSRKACFRLPTISSYRKC